MNKYFLLPSINTRGTYSRPKLRNRSEIVSSNHQTQSKIRKKVHDYSQKLIDDFKLIVVNTPPKLTNKEMRSIVTSFGYSSQDKIIENNTKIILTHILKRWNEKSQAPTQVHMQ